MKTLLTLFLITVALSTFGQVENDSQTYFKSGKLKTEKKFDKSCNCDKLTEYFESGKVRSSKTYLHGGPFNTQLDGADILYFENGTIQIYYFWKDGSPSGRIYCNFADGKLAYEKFFANKFKTGTWKFYNQDGTLKEEEIFVDNKTPWDSNDDYATCKFYFKSKLVYTVELVAGKKTNLTVIDKDSYDKLIASEPPTGKKLFTQNCASCHSVNIDIVGPKMQGVTENRTNEWLTRMIINGDALVKSGDKDAVALYKKYNNMQHPNFERLSKDEVTAIIEYLKTLK
jgi:antitoxin component YwqK of YwqJK toxin-antitoxin module